MKIIKTSRFLAAYGPSVDDQPGFIKRDVQGQESLFDESGAVPSSTKDITNKWKLKKKKKKLKKNDHRKQN